MIKSVQDVTTQRIFSNLSMYIEYKTLNSFNKIMLLSDVIIVDFVEFNLNNYNTSKLLSHELVAKAW